jgi:hypothetical protein
MAKNARTDQVEARWLACASMRTYVEGSQKLSWERVSCHKGKEAARTKGFEEVRDEMKLARCGMAFAPLGLGQRRDFRKALGSCPTSRIDTSNFDHHHVRRYRTTKEGEVCTKRTDLIEPAKR